MDLDHDIYVNSDEEFVGNFRNELAQIVFKCPNNQIKMFNLCCGSIIVAAKCDEHPQNVLYTSGQICIFCSTLCDDLFISYVLNIYPSFAGRQ